jgi:S1-C subfamily serine protease
VLGCDLSLRQGTAVAIDRGTLGPAIVTNQHVVGTFRSLDVSEDGFRPVPATGASVLPNADVAVVTAGGLGVAPLELATEDPQPGDPVRFAGYPHDAAAPSLPDGLVVDSARVVDYVFSPSPVTRTMPVMRVMRLSARAVPGMSGGPVLDRGGRIAGLVFGVQSPTDDTLAVPASVLRRLLAGPSSSPGRC